MSFFHLLVIIISSSFIFLILFQGFHSKSAVWFPLSVSDEETQSVLSSLPSFTSSGSLCLSNIAQKMQLVSLDLPSDIPDISVLLLVITCQLFICRDNNTCTQVKEQRLQCVNIKKDGVQQENIEIGLDVK